VEEADKRVEPHGGQRGDAVVAEERIEEGEQGVEGVAWGAAVAPIHGELGAHSRAKMAGKFGKVEGGGMAFNSAQIVELQCRGELTETGGERVDEQGECGGVVGGIGFAGGAGDEPAGVLDFAGDEGAGEGCGARRIGGGGVLGGAEQDGALGHAFDAGFETAPVGKITDGGTVFPTEAHGRGRDVDIGSEGEDGFAVVDGERELELAVVFDAQREAVTVDGELGREEVEGVLEELGHAGGGREGDLRFDI